MITGIRLIPLLDAISAAFEAASKGLLLLPAQAGQLSLEQPLSPVLMLAPFSFTQAEGEPFGIGQKSK